MISKKDFYFFEKWFVYSHKKQIDGCLGLWTEAVTDCKWARENVF